MLLMAAMYVPNIFGTRDQVNGIILSVTAHPNSTPPTPTPTPAVCQTTCPTSTSTVYPGYKCPANNPSVTQQCPVAQCLSQSVTTTTITSIVPCSTDIITLPNGCTVPQSCVGQPVSTVTVTPCPTRCPDPCPRSDVTERRLLGGGCPRTA